MAAVRRHFLEMGKGKRARGRRGRRGEERKQNDEHTILHGFSK